MLAVDPVNDPGYSGIGPIKSTQLDYDSDRLGPKHLRYVRHHTFSPNSGDWVKTVGKQFGFWGELKGRSKWVKDKLTPAFKKFCLDKFDEQKKMILVLDVSVALINRLCSLVLC